MNIPSRFTFWRKDTTGAATIQYLHADVVARCTADTASAALVRRWFFSKPGDFIEISIWARFVSGGTTGGQFRLDNISGASHSVIKQIDLKTKSWRKYTISYQRNMLGDSLGNVLCFAAGFNTEKDGIIDLREPEVRINGHLSSSPRTIMQGTIVFNASGTPSVDVRSPNELITQVSGDFANGRVNISPIIPLLYRAISGTPDPIRDIAPEVIVSVSKNVPPAATETPVQVISRVNMDTGALSLYFYNNTGALITNAVLLRDYILTFRLSA